ncbi:MAG: tail fiber domain-containing protein, partial [Bacteroidota bacterium]
GFPDADTTNFHNWDRDSIGVFSFASGFNTKARGDFSVAMGEKSYALGNSAMALGNGNIAKGNFSITAGSNNIAEGESSTAFGNGTKASGIFSFASGEFSRSSGNYSTTFGSNTEASGTFSTAFGNSTTASGANSTAMGRNANTNNHTSTFCIAGVGGNLITSNTADNQMMMRFDNYTFFVGSDPFTNYAFLVNATNGWQHTSDIRKKENFIELNGETVLKKIAKIPFYSWNFKGKEMKEYRHYGIMAQDFYHSFGKDDLGIIGNDTTVSALDLLGVAYSGIKALEKRTQDLQIQNEFLFHEIAALKALIQPKRNKYTLKKSHPAKKEELFTVK